MNQKKLSSTLSETFIPYIQKEQLVQDMQFLLLLESSEFNSDQSLNTLVVIPGDVPLIRKNDIDKLVNDVKK